MAVGLFLVLLLLGAQGAPPLRAQDDDPEPPETDRRVDLRLWVDSELDDTDDGPGDGLCRGTRTGACTLRAAIMESNARPGEERIELPAGTFFLTLTGAAEDEARTGDLDITGLVTIVGEGGGRTIVHGNWRDRAFDVLWGADAILEGLTIEGGTVFWDEGYPAPDGGGIRNTGTLTVRKCVIRDNRVARDHGRGGGISNAEDGYLLVEDTTIDRNRVSGARGRGGGLENQGDLELYRSTISRNEVVDGVGAGLANDGDEGATLNNVTISTNRIVGTGGRGGGIWNAGFLDITNGTIVDNDAPTGEAGGIHTARQPFSIVLRATIVASNGGRNCAGPVTSEGDNLEDANDCKLRAPGDLVARTPRLGPLRDNGGVTKSHLPLLGSPAIDAGFSNWCDLLDQRRRPRYLDGNGDGSPVCDIGAVEVQGSEHERAVRSADRTPVGRSTPVQRQQRERTNRGGRDDERTEGHVTAVQCEPPTPWAAIVTLDGEQRLWLHDKARTRCAGLAPGDYVTAEGVKQTEHQFDAYSLTVERASPPADPETPRASADGGRRSRR